MACALTLLSAGGMLIAERGWLAAKARVAGVLIDRAFAMHLRDGGSHRPWGWADMHPIARLEVPRLGVRRTVLSGATGATLAFGPGRIHGTADPNGEGNCVLAGHRDGSFAFLEKLRRGDRIVLRTHGGVVSYVVEELIVADRRDASILEGSDGTRLTLITCYPFGGLRRSDLRYVVTCAPCPETASGVAHGRLISSRWTFASSAMPGTAESRSRARSGSASDGLPSSRSSIGGWRPTTATSS
jgi:sortase A